MNMPATNIDDTKLNVHHFAKGQRDCRDGVQHKAGRGESYDQGYAFQYELEQIRSERSNHGHN